MVRERLKIKRNLTAFGGLALWILLGATGYTQELSKRESALFVLGPHPVYVEPPLRITAAGIKDSSGQSFCWTKIVAAKLSPSDQADFDRMKKWVGDWSYQLDLRLRRGDFQQLHRIARGVDLEGWEGDSLPKARAMLAELMGLITDHREEEAVGKWAAVIRSPISAQLIAEYPRVSMTSEELKNGLLDQLLPIFFDQDAARAAYQDLVEMWRTGGIRGWGEQVYLAALLIAQGDLAQAETQIQNWSAESQPLLDEWALVFRAQLELLKEEAGRVEVIALENQLEKLSPPAGLVGRFVLVGDKTRRAETERQHRAALLDWLKITAECEKNYPGLAAAGLAAACSLAEEQNWAFEARRLRTELTKRFANTFHGRHQQHQP